MCDTESSFNDATADAIRVLINSIAFGSSDNERETLVERTLDKVDSLCLSANESREFMNTVIKASHDNEVIRKLRAELFDGIWNDDNNDKMCADTAIDTVSYIISHNMLEVERLQHHVDEQLRDTEYIKKFKAKVDESLLDEIQRRNDYEIRHCVHAVPWANLAINELMAMLRGVNGGNEKSKPGSSDE